VPRQKNEPAFAKPKIQKKSILEREEKRRRSGNSPDIAHKTGEAKKGRNRRLNRPSKIMPCANGFLIKREGKVCDGALTECHPTRQRIEYSGLAAGGSIKKVRQKEGGDHPL